MVATLLKRKTTATISARTMWRDRSGVKLKKTPTANPAARLLSSASAEIASWILSRIFAHPSKGALPPAVHGPGVAEMPEGPEGRASIRRSRIERSPRK